MPLQQAKIELFLGPLSGAQAADAATFIRRRPIAVRFFGTTAAARSYARTFLALLFPSPLFSVVLHPDGGPSDTTELLF